MFARVAIAVLLAFTPVRAPAAGPDATSLAERAAKTAERATSATDPAVAAIAAFEAHNLWQKAHQADDDDSHLCAARSLLAKICARPDLDPSHRPSLERSRDALGQLHCARPRRQGAVGSSRIPSPPINAPSLTVPTLGAHDRQRPLIQIDLRPKLPAPIPSEDRSDLTAADPARPSDVMVEQHPRALDLNLDLDLDLDEAQPRHEALQIAGGISLALGLVTLGVMTPFASRDASYAREVRSLTAIKDGSGGTLTEAQGERLSDLMAESRSTFRTSLALGLSGSVMTLLGASLLLAGHRRSARSLALSPSVDRSSASLTFQGRF